MPAASVSASRGQPVTGVAVARTASYSSRPGGTSGAGVSRMITTRRTLGRLSRIAAGPGDTLGNRLLRPEPPAPHEQVRQRERLVHHEVVELRTHRHRPPGSLDVARGSTTRPRPGGIVPPAEAREFRTDGSGRCPGSTPGT